MIGKIKYGFNLGGRFIYFRSGRKDYVTYNHFDFYPEYLGKNLIAEFKNLSEDDLTQLNDRITKIQLVDENKAPTSKQIEHTRSWHNLSVSDQSTDDWYCLLRNAQGTLLPYMKGELTIMLNSKSFLSDSLFCEYAYIFNLSKNVLEFYKGYNKNPKAPGRYAHLRNGRDTMGYYGAALVAEFPFAKLRDLPADDIVKEMNRDDN